MVIDEFHIRPFYVPGVYPVTMGPRPWAGRLLKLDVPLRPIRRSFGSLPSGPAPLSRGHGTRPSVIERHDLQECESGRAKTRRYSKIEVGIGRTQME